MNEETEANVSPPRPEEHWSFLRDVAVFQLKMVVDNLRDFALIPVSLGAAAIDLIFKSELFYGVLRWGAESEKIIDVYSPLARRDGTREMDPTSVGPAFTIDAAVARLESVVVRECEKGGTAASIKAAMDRAIAQLHKETGPTRDKATDLVTRAAGQLRDSAKRNEGSLREEFRIMRWSAGGKTGENAERPTPNVERPNEGDGSDA